MKVKVETHGTGVTVETYEHEHPTAFGAAVIDERGRVVALASNSANRDHAVRAVLRKLQETLDRARAIAAEMGVLS